MQSAVFRMGKGNLASHLLMMHGVLWLICMSVLALLALVSCLFVDLRWGVVFLMIVFLIAPMVLAFLFFFYGLQQFTAVNTVYHSIALTDEGMIINVYDKKRQDKGNSDEKDSKGQNEGFDLLLTYKVSYSDLGRINVGMKSVTFPVREKGKGFVWIPMNAFDDSRAFSDFIGLISSGMER